MSDAAIFTTLAIASVLVWKLYKRKTVTTTTEGLESSLYRVNQDNEPWMENSDDTTTDAWYRTTFVLVMHDPPDMFYEPKEWSHTTVILIRNQNDGALVLPSGFLYEGETYVHCATRQLLNTMNIDVCQPENSLHHMFTFPYEDLKHWADFMECVYRGSTDDLPSQSIIAMSLEELKELVQSHNEDSSAKDFNIVFSSESYYALRLYFQRQMDLRAKRRLLKGYSSADLEHYGLRRSLSSRIVFVDDSDTKRSEAVEFTMQTDDGMSPKRLFEADIVLLGVSRAGKTPLSLLLSQTMGFKVANIPLVVDVPPPPQLFKVNPRRVFCLTVDENDLKRFRRNRLQRELRNSKKSSTYADIGYIRRDLENAQKLIHNHGFTEINVSGRALEESAALIASKIRERFPETEIGLSGSGHGLT